MSRKIIYASSEIPAMLIERNGEDDMLENLDIRELKLVTKSQSAPDELNIISFEVKSFVYTEGELTLHINETAPVLADRQKKQEVGNLFSED